MLTTYGMLSRRKRLIEADWGLVVIDEAQAIKTPGARQTRFRQFVKGLEARDRRAGRFLVARPEAPAGRTGPSSNCSRAACPTASWPR